MNNIYKILLLFLVMLSEPVTAQTFGQVDLERLVMNHPMMKNFDPATGHFNNTSHAIRDIDELIEEKKAYEAELESINKKEKINSFNAFYDDIDDEESFWNQVSELAKQKELLEHKKIKNNNLLINNGIPGYDELYPIIDNITSDVWKPLYSPDKIILNKMPRYASDIPKLEGNDLHAFWYKKNPTILEKYLSKASVIGLIFPNVDKTVIYQKESGIK